VEEEIMNKAQKKALRKLAPMFIAVTSVIAFVLVFGHPWTMGLPLYGWEYDEELTNAYINDTFEGETPVGYAYKVYVISNGCSSCSRMIQLYGRVDTPYEWWHLKDEGYVDGEGNMFWT
jgi:hypothetical protein